VEDQGHRVTGASAIQRRLGRLEMAQGTRWDGRWGCLEWDAFRSNAAMRDASLVLRVPGGRRLRLTMRANWWAPSDDEQ
jgi:hypothetical protein